MYCNMIRGQMLARTLALCLAALACAPLAAQNNAATGTPAVTAGGAALTGAPSEDVQLTADKGTIADADGITTFTPAWAWHEGGTADGDFTAIASATAATFTPLQAHVDRFIRVCATFDDDDGTSETACWTSSAAVANVNDVPSGGPAHRADNGTDTTGDNMVAATDGTPLVMVASGAQIGDADGIGNPVYLWQWHRASSQANAQTLTANDPSVAGWPIAGADSNVYTPVDADIGAWLVACVHYRDDHEASERACTHLMQTTNVNDPPTGRVAIQPNASQPSGTAPAHTNASFTTVVQGVRYTMADTTHGGTLGDADGLPTGTSRYAASDEGISWQYGTSADGPWTEAAFNKDSGTDANRFTVSATAAAAGWMRVCLFYEDGQGTVEGGDSTSAATRALADSQSTCSPPATVQNVNDAPVATGNLVGALMGGSYTFLLRDFPYTDIDGDALTHVIISALPPSGTGTLQLSGTDVAAGQEIPVAQINAGNLIWTPPADAAPSGSYAGLGYRVRDDGSDGTDNRDSGEAVFTLTILAATPTAHTGGVTISGTPAEGTELTITSTVMDDNGRRGDSSVFVWSQGGPVETTDMSGNTIMSAPSLTDENAWTAIAGADGETFTPEDDQVGDYLRFCWTYMDWGGTTEGPICAATSAIVTGTNDTPVSADFSIEVPSHTSLSDSNFPFYMSFGDFPWIDGESEIPASITVSIPAGFPGELHDTSAGVRIPPGGSETISRPSGPNPGTSNVIRYWPGNLARRLGATRNFVSFTFTATDDDGASSGPHTVTVHLTEVPQQPTAGTPILAALNPNDLLFTEDAQMTTYLLLRRSTNPDGLHDPNGIHDTVTTWQQGDSASGPWTDIEGTTRRTSFTPLQAHVGKWLRTCTIVTDRHPIQQTTGPHCTAPGGPIVNVDDAPVAGPEQNVPDIHVNDTHDADSPYVFTRANFPFTDEDGDALTHVIISALPSIPATGSLLWGGNAVEVGNAIPVADIDNGMLVFQIAEGVGTGSGGTFTYGVRANGVDGTVGANAGIFVRASTQSAASGNLVVGTVADGLAVVGDLSEDVALAVIQDAVIDSNGRAHGTQMHSWQVADPVMSGGTSSAPAMGSEDWETVFATSDNSNYNFTPLQAHVGKYLRYCLSFTDSLGNDEGPFCSTPQLVANTNDDATGQPVVESENVARDGYLREGIGTNLFISIRDATIADEDGLPEFLGGPSWQWSMQISADSGATWSEHRHGTTTAFPAAFPAISGAGMSQDLVGLLMRGCVFFTDSTGNAEGGDTTDASTRVSSATLCSDGLPVLNENDEPTGSLGAHDMAVAEGDALALDPTGLMDRDGATRATFRWQWQAAAPESMAAPDADSAAWADIAGATAASFTPDDAQVGQHIRGCVSYTDDQGTAERFCEAYDAAVTNTNDAPVAYDTTLFVPTTAAVDAHTFLAIDFPYADEDGANDVTSLQITQIPGTGTGTLSKGSTALTTGTTAFTLAELGSSQLTYSPATGATASANYATFKYTVTDGAGAVSNEATVTLDLVTDRQQLAARGAPSLAATIGTLYDEDVPITATTRGLLDANGIDAATVAWQWQVADAADGAYSPIAGANAATFTPLQAQVGRFVRICARFTDGDGNAEGPLCSVPAAAIANVDDAPVAADATLHVPWTADSNNPFRFNPAHFGVTDEDGDALDFIVITRVPAQGMLRFGSTVISVGDVPLRVPNGIELYDLSWHPPQVQSASAGYDSLAWNANSGGRASNEATLTIDLIPPGPVAATGRPRVADEDGTPPAGQSVLEDHLYTGITTGITEPNGINESTLQWQWQSAPSPQVGTPPDSAFVDIAGQNMAQFTPLQAHVGLSVRVCVSFQDQSNPPTTEGPLCSPSRAVSNVNDAPVSGDSEVFVQTIATADAPYTFSAADFPFTDGDAETTPALPNSTLASVTIVTAPTADGTFTAGGTAVADGTVVAADDLGTLIYYPPADTDAADGYATFTFMLSDGRDDSDVHTMTINIVSPTQMAAVGQPAITGTPAQNATLTAGRGTVRDPNGIDTASIEWQWQQATAADGTFTAIAGASGADADEFMPTQAQVGMFLQVCMTFMDSYVDTATNTPQPGSERRCSAAFGPITNVNDAPVAEDTTYQAARDGNSPTVTIPASAFAAAYSDPDGPGDVMEQVTITRLPPEADGTLQFNGMALTVTAESGHTLMVEDGDFMGGDLTFTIAENAGNLQDTALDFTLSDGELDSNTATLTITFGKDIEEEQVQQVSAILSVAAVTNATNAIGGAISSVPTPTAFDISMDGTSLMSAAQKLGQSKTADSPHHDWYLGTAPQWEHNAAYNASDNSAESLLHRLQSMANGDIALNYSLTDTSNMRFWARYQSLDINGNEGEMLEYDGSGTGFYLGADNQITDTMRIGLAIGTDSSDITLDLDEDGTDDEATRSATSFYPYLHIDLGNNNNARVIAGFGSGTLDIKSTANSNSTASADLSWNMLAASISHHRQMKGNLSARFDGSLQLGNTSTDETTFTNGSTLMAGKSSASELTINAELRYQSNNITPFASLATRKLGGDLSQSVALDMAFGADLQTSPANLRIAITRQINDTIHQRHSISLDASTNPGASGVTASLGSRYDSITGRPQWQSTIGWQRRNFQTSLQASPGAYRLQARLRW